MIIDQLPSITLPVEDTDEMPIERGQYTYKINLADLLGSASADITVIAAEYDETASYAVGDYCTHEGLFYICITPVTAEAWDATKWDEVTVGEELQKAGGVYVGTTEPTDENIKIWLDTDEPGMSAVSSVNGKTGTVVLDADDVPFMELLWTNASPTSSFAAQEVSLDLSGCNFALVVFHASSTNAYFTNPVLAPVVSGKSSVIQYITNNGTNLMRYSRSFEVKSTSVTFADGLQQIQGSSGTTKNDCVIPYQIYGIKGVTT